MLQDEILEELRQIKERLAFEAGYDIDRLADQANAAAARLLPNATYVRNREDIENFYRQQVPEQPGTSYRSEQGTSDAVAEPPAPYGDAGP